MTPASAGAVKNIKNAMEQNKIKILIIFFFILINDLILSDILKDNLDILMKFPCYFEEDCYGCCYDLSLSEKYIYSNYSFNFYPAENEIKVGFRKATEYNGTYKNVCIFKPNGEIKECRNEKIANSHFKKPIPEDLLLRIQKINKNYYEILIDHKKWEFINYFSDGKRFIIAINQNDYYPNYEGLEKTSNFLILWGDNKNLFSQELKWIKNIEASAINSENIFLENAEKCYYTNCHYFNVDEYFMSYDPDGIWVGISYYNGEGCVGVGGIIFLPFDGKEIEVYKPYWLLHYSVQKIIPIGKGKAILSPFVIYEGVNGYYFPSPLIFNRYEKKFYFFKILDRIFENCEDFYINNDNLWIASNHYLYHFKIKDDKIILNKRFIPDSKGENLIEAKEEYIVDALNSKECERWRWGIRYGEFLSFKNLIINFEKEYEKLREGFCTIEESSAINDFYIYRWIILIAITKMGGSKFFEENLEKILRENPLFYNSGYLFYRYAYLKNFLKNFEEKIQKSDEINFLSISKMRKSYKREDKIFKKLFEIKKSKKTEYLNFLEKIILSEKEDFFIRSYALEVLKEINKNEFNKTTKKIKDKFLKALSDILSSEEEFYLITN